VLVSLRCTLASAFLAVAALRRGWEEFRELRAGRPAHLRVPRLYRALRLHRGTYLGIALSTAANAAILQAATPVMVALGARFYLKERLRRDSGRGGRLVAGVLLVITRKLAGHRPSRSDARRLHPDDLAGRLERLHRSTASRCSRCTPAVATTASYILGSAMPCR
jgi:drug/metabolite transporter (DMT)-like permease